MQKPILRSLVSNCGSAGAETIRSPECVPRAREAAAQTHRYRGISGYGESRRGDVKKPAIRSRECHVRGRLQHKPTLRRNLDCGRLQHKPTAAAESPTAGDGSACRVRVRLQHKPIGLAECPATERAGAKMLKNPQSDHGSATCAGGCNTNPQLRRNLDCGGAEMPKPILRSEHKPIAAAESPTAGDGSACRARVRLQHKPIGVAESPATERAGNPITGVPRAREAATQTHSCGGISTAGARRCQNRFSAVSTNP